MTTSDAPRPRPVTPRQAAQILAERDPVLARLRAGAGPPVFPKPTDTHFATLVRSVTYQQLAGAAARAIHGRLILALDGEVTPERLLATPAEVLRAAGLSARKAASLQDLATKVLDGTVVLDSRRLARESDEEIVARLSTVSGIGKWSAEIFLMFQLRRMDVWPTGISRCAGGSAWRGTSPRPPRSNSTSSASRTGLIAASSPGIAGELPSFTPAPSAPL